MWRMIWPIALVCLSLALQAVTVQGGDAKTLKIASFNVQVFGRTKADKADVMATLVKIIQLYDIVLIQEIRDASGEAILKLLDQVNEAGPHQYALQLSDRLGRTSSKEQYAYLYRLESGLSMVDTYQYPDPDDVFQREPFAIRFQTTTTDVTEFVLVGVHVDPDEAPTEIDALDAVHVAVSAHWSTNNILIMGDLNADCSYVTKKEMPKLKLRVNTDYHWLIMDDADTTTSNTDCAYDRFIMTGAAFVASVVPDSPKVFHFDQEYGLTQEQAKAVSDHYPIELVLKESPAAGALSTAVSTCSGILNRMRSYFSNWHIEL